MARPQKDSVDYFPFDANFFWDEKIRLIKSEFGAKGILVYTFILCEIYRSNGYYLDWNDDTCLLVSEYLGIRRDTAFVHDTVNQCVNRSLFSKDVFNTFGVLTSTGIQRRYVRAVEKRGEIRIKRELCLLDFSDIRDVPNKLRSKLVLIDVSGTENMGFRYQKPLNEIKLNEIKVKCDANKDELNRKESTTPVVPSSSAPTADEVKAFFAAERLSVLPIKFFSYYTQRGWCVNGESIVGIWRLKAREWDERERRRSEQAQTDKAPASFSADDLAQLGAI